MCILNTTLNNLLQTIVSLPITTVTTFFNTNSRKTEISSIFRSFYIRVQQSSSCLFQFVSNNNFTTTLIKPLGARTFLKLGTSHSLKYILRILGFADLTVVSFFQLIACNYFTSILRLLAHFWATVKLVFRGGVWMWWTAAEISAIYRAF